jgi:hypothetical protein
LEQEKVIALSLLLSKASSKPKVWIIQKNFVFLEGTGARRPSASSFPPSGGKRKKRFFKMFRIKI